MLTMSLAEIVHAFIDVQDAVSTRAELTASIHSAMADPWRGGGGIWESHPHFPMNEKMKSSEKLKVHSDL